MQDFRSTPQKYKPFRVFFRVSYWLCQCRILNRVQSCVCFALTAKTGCLKKTTQSSFGNSFFLTKKRDWFKDSKLSLFRLLTTIRRNCEKYISRKSILFFFLMPTKNQGENTNGSFIRSSTPGYDNFPFFWKRAISAHLRGRGAGIET